MQSAEDVVAGKKPQDVAKMRLGGDGRETMLVSGRYRFTRHGVHPLLSELPPLLRVGCGEGWRSMALEHGVQLLAVEVASTHPGSRAIVAHLLEVLFLQALRHHVEDAHCERPGWLRGLRDERIARALGCIHGEPERPWSTATLAEQAGMPRAAFAAEFTALVGEPPPDYLTRWRMQTALQALREPGCQLGQVAQAVGYSSAATFTRTFKRMVGMPPAEYRRSASAGMEPLMAGIAQPPGNGGAIYAAERFSSRP